MRESARLWKKKNKDKIRQYNKKYRAAHLIEERIYFRKWKKAHPDYMRIYMKNYYWKHRDELLRKQRYAYCHGKKETKAKK